VETGLFHTKEPDKARQALQAIDPWLARRVVIRKAERDWVIAPIDPADHDTVRDLLRLKNIDVPARPLTAAYIESSIETIRNGGSVRAAITSAQKALQGPRVAFPIERRGKRIRVRFTNGSYGYVSPDYPLLHA